MDGMIFDIKEMAVHDGPGIRTTVFLKGCPLRCLWCHNPEGLEGTEQLLYQENRCTHCGLCNQKCSHPECQPFGKCLHRCPQNCLTISGRRISAESLEEEMVQSANAYGPGFGGFTFSGGEPLAQPEFLLDMISRLKNRYSLCIETSGYCNSKVFGEIISQLDYVFMDLKLADDISHQYYTGVSNERIWENFSLLKQSGVPYTVRTPLIPGITDTKENLEAIKVRIGESSWEKLPYNHLAGAKYRLLRKKFPMQN